MARTLDGGLRRGGNDPQPALWIAAPVHCNLDVGLSGLFAQMRELARTDPEESLHNRWVKLAASASGEFCQRFVRGACGTVGSL